MTMPALVADPFILAVVGTIVAVFFFVVVFIATRFKRCPSNRILVIYGKVGRERTARCIHGGGTFVYPLIQDYAFLDLSPRTIEIDLIGALSKKNIRVNVPSTFTVGISTRPEITQNAAERLLGLSDAQIKEQCKDIILGQMRLVIATLSIEEINQDREKFLELVNQNVGIELAKIGLDVINVNIRDITDESGYIDAIGKKAAAEAVNQARIEVAQAEQKGAIGEAEAMKIRQVAVAEQNSLSAQGQKKAETEQRVALAAYEASAMQGQKKAERDQAVAVARLEAEAATGQKEAERSQRVQVSTLEADAVAGENKAKAAIAGANAELAEKEAEARRRSLVARADADTKILLAEKERETALLAKEQIAQQEIDRLKVEIEADARAEQIRRVARGEADGILARRKAEADGQRMLLDAKAAGYAAMIKACGDRPEMASTLLMVEKITEVVAEQVKAIQNLKIDKITVWDGGRGEGGTTAGFLSSLIGSLPALHELAKQAGIELPAVLGRVPPEGPGPEATGKKPQPAA
jgi:flotillin